MTKWLLIINIAVYFIEMILNTAPPAPAGFSQEHDTLLWNLGYFSVDAGVYGGQIWRFLTFQFLHGSFGHLFANMLGLFFFGPFVERWWGSKKFLVYYFACGVAGALAYTLLLVMPGLIPSDESWVQMIGASAGIYGILVAVAIIAPNLKVLLYFVIPISMRVFAIGALCFAAYVALSNGHNAGGQAAHLGGALLGFILMKNPYLLSFLDSHSRSGKRVVDAQVVREQKLRPKIHINLDDSEVDRILDKVNREGMQSLSESEKNILKRAAGK